MDVFKLLSEPFNPSTVKWRVGSTNAKKLNCKPWEATKGMALAYVDARIVMVRLDDVLGAENWQDKYFETQTGRIMCELSIRISGEWITKSDGAGMTGTEGEKGAISDAFKRAAVKFGIGRYLYAFPSSWVDLKNGNIANPPQLPDWALPKAHDMSVLQALDHYYDEVTQMREFFANGNLNEVASVWFDIPRDPDGVDHQSLIVRTAPTRGGVIPTDLRNFLMRDVSKYKTGE